MMSVKWKMKKNSPKRIRKCEKISWNSIGAVDGRGTIEGQVALSFAVKYFLDDSLQNQLLRSGRFYDRECYEEAGKLEDEYMKKVNESHNELRIVKETRESTEQ